MDKCNDILKKKESNNIYGMDVIYTYSYIYVIRTNTYV